MRYDPVTRRALPDDIPNTPVGTLEEFQKFQMPARAYMSCHEPTVDGTIKGCPLWHICTMSYKGKKLEEGGGPRNHAWEHMKGPAEGGAVVRSTQPCFWGVERLDLVQRNKGMLQIIGNEGDEYEIETVVASPTAMDPTNREQKRVKKVVIPFQRIGESKQMVQARLRAEVEKRERERIANERAAEVLAIPGGVTPLDQRGGRGGKGSKKEG